MKERVLAKETVLRWIQEDYSWRESKYEYPIVSYYEYLRNKALSSCYSVTSLDHILSDLCKNDVIEVNRNGNIISFTLKN